MATIVKLRDSDQHAILVGVGYGKFMSSRPGMVFGNMLPSDESGKSEMAAVSTAEGEILWCRSHELVIVSVDGVAPREHLEGYFRQSAGR